MKCDICKDNEANIHIQEVINNNIKTLHICDSCAKSYGFKNGMMNIGFNLMDFFEKFDPFKTLEPDKKKNKNKKMIIEDENIIRCSKCSMSYDDFLEKGKFGCAFCYTAFKEQVKPIIRRIHGKTTHKGNFPEKYKETIKYVKEIKLLNNKLNIEVKKENFENAAKIRDEIKKINSLMEKEHA